MLTPLAVATQTIAVVGPTLGGLLIGLGGWRTIFPVNVPLPLACLVLGCCGCRGTRRPARRRRPTGLDLPAWPCSPVTLATLLLFLMDPGPATGTCSCSPPSPAAAFAGASCGSADPFIDLRVLGGNGPLLATYARQFLGSSSRTLPLRLHAVAGGGPRAERVPAGLVLLPMFLVGDRLGRLRTPTRVRRQAPRRQLGRSSPPARRCCSSGRPARSGCSSCCRLVVGVPQGLNSLANQNALYHQADPARMGSSAGLLRTFIYLGAMVASAANAAFFHHGADTGGLHHLALFMLAGAVLLLG